MGHKRKRNNQKFLSSTSSSSSSLNTLSASTTTSGTAFASSSSIASSRFIPSAASSSTASFSSSLCMDEPVFKSRMPKIDENMTFEDLLEATSIEDSMDAILPSGLTPIKVDSDEEDGEDDELFYKKCAKIPMLRDPSPQPYDNNRSSNAKKTEYEVERILLKRNHENSYCLKWHGYRLNESTWEKSWNLLKCDDVIKTFDDRQKLCFEIYQSLPKKEEYKGYLDTWINGIFTAAFIEACILEEIFMKFCKRNGFEKFYVENWTRLSEVFPDFTFLAENIFSQKAKLVLEATDTPAYLCKCDGCGKKNQPCQCVDGSVTATGLLRTSDDYATECHRDCKCGKQCVGKIYQRGRTIPVILFKTPHCGWGLRTAVDIKFNRFVVEYVGRVKLNEECRGITDETYLFDIDVEDDDDSSKKSAYFVVDATKEGNASRFINHSCDPNLEVKLIKGYYAQKKYARVIFIANRHIHAGEELTFNYYKHEPNFTLVNSTTPICRCGFEKCRKYLI